MNALSQNGDGEMDFKEFMNMVKYLKGKDYQYGREALENKIRKAFRYRNTCTLKIARHLVI